MPLAKASEGKGHGAEDMGVADEFFPSAKFIWRKFGGHGSRRAEISWSFGARWNHIPIFALFASVSQQSAGAQSRLSFVR